GARKFGMRDALATDLGKGHFDAAAVADDALVLDLLVLAAGAFPILGWAKDLLAKEPALFRFEGAVVDRLRLFYFAARPVIADHFVSSNADAELIKLKGLYLLFRLVSRATAKLILFIFGRSLG